MKIGSHISSAGGFCAMYHKACSIGCDTMQFFVRNPRGGKAKAIDENDLTEFHRLLTEGNCSPVVVHAPYTMNICSPKTDVRQFGLEMMREDLERMEYFPGNYYNFHPGSAVGQPQELAVRLIADGLNTILETDFHSLILLETMAGKGSEVGATFDQLAQIIDLLERPEKVGICLDTCHIWDGGYNIAEDLDGVLCTFDAVLGLGKLKAIHLNDSLNPCGSKKDRHALIGKGEIGFDALCACLTNPMLSELPFLLETPTDDAGHGKEIQSLRAAVYAEKNENFQ